MTGAMYAAVAGMKSHMDKLNVIGNNVANVNTYGYKTARTTFQESLYTTVRSGSNGSASLGGANPAQLGYGCNIGTIDLDMSTQKYVPTGIGTDCMIDGDGFFLVGSKPAANGDGLEEVNAQDLYLTRVGQFHFDSNGYLVDAGQNVVYGFVTRSNTTDGKAGECGEKPDTSTQLVPIRLPLAAREGNASNIKPGTAIFPGVNTTSGMNAYDQGGTDGLTDGSTTIEVNVDSISIDGTTGKITCVNNVGDKQIVVGYIPLAKVANPSGVSHVQGAYYRAGEGAGSCVAASIGGALDGKYLNNAAATATDREAINSTGETKVISNGLESSGTDIATEFSEMITTQRGYQANTRIITVTDAMLEELVNIKR